MPLRMLGDLVNDLAICNSFKSDYRSIPISGISFDSRKVCPGYLFIPLSGVGQDGHMYISEAVRQGAVAVIGSQKIDLGIVPYIQVENTRQALALVSAAFYGYPARRLTVIGVTGTDGKTTTCNLIYSIMRHAGLKTGLISTVNAIIGDEVLDTGFHVTTPDAPDVQRYLAMMIDAGLTHVILEVTSHGLAQDRVTGCEFDIGVVTNITHEHLDFHKEYEHYRAAKGRLFEYLAATQDKANGNPRLAVLNKDDISFAFLNELTKVKKVDYGLDLTAKFFASEIRSTKTGTEFSITFDKGKCVIESNLIGNYNVYNCLAAFSSCTEGLGISPATASEGIHLMDGVPGRYEIIDLGQNYEAVVDFAHTPNALRMVLLEARKRTCGKLIVVFGSAGLRDREKRKLMASISSELADVTILTAEDPRTEPLDLILEEMAEAARKKGAIEENDFWVVPDRGDAIRKAISLADEGDLVIACGKGHEQSMCFGETEYPWDDRKAVKAALAESLHIKGEEMPLLPTSNG